MARRQSVLKDLSEFEWRQLSLVTTSAEREEGSDRAGQHCDPSIPRFQQLLLLPTIDPRPIPHAPLATPSTRFAPPKILLQHRLHATESHDRQHRRTSIARICIVSEEVGKAFLGLEEQIPPVIPRLRLEGAVMEEAAERGVGAAEDHEVWFQGCVAVECDGVFVG